MLRINPFVSKNGRGDRNRLNAADLLLRTSAYFSLVEQKPPNP
jgi:hypothetical protein